MLRALSTAGVQAARRAAAVEGNVTALGARAFADAVPGKRDGDTLTLEVRRRSVRLRVWGAAWPQPSLGRRRRSSAAAHSSAHSRPRRSTR
jgi:hypothetical protein